jgi:hypothetical protein
MTTTVARAARLPSRILSGVLIGLVRGYQCTVGPLFCALFGPVCRFEPSCSQYFIQAVQKHGPWRGAVKGAWRVCRCNPFCQGGYDPP